MSAETSNFVAYYRVSTRRQGRSGLGLEAQRTTVQSFCATAGARLVAEFTETESGKRTDRPKLRDALATCRIHRAILVVAKLDRLARNAAFLLSLRDASVEIVACDLPAMNRMTVGIMAVVAEEEARMISERTKLALAAARRRGVILGTPANLSDESRLLGTEASAAARAAAAKRRASDLEPVIQSAIAAGHRSLRAIAAELNRAGIVSSRGRQWTAMSISRVMRRACFPVDMPSRK